MMIAYSAADVIVISLASILLLCYAGAIHALVQRPESAQTSLDRAIASRRKPWALLGVLAVAGLLARLATVTVLAVTGLTRRHPQACARSGH